MIGRISRRARQFAGALDDKPVDNAEIDRLVRTASDIAEASSAEPDVRFRTDLRSKLMNEASTVLVRSTEPADDSSVTPSPVRIRRPRRRVAILATACLVIALGAGTVVTSSHAIPGDVLYPVKLQVESVKSGLHYSDFSKGDYTLSLANKRLAEVTTLTSKDADPDLVSQTLNRFSKDAREGAAQLFADHESGTGDRSVEAVQAFAQASSTTLDALRGSVPAQASDAYRDAIGTLDALAGQVSTLCAECDVDDMTSLRSSVSDKAKDESSHQKEKTSKDGAGKHPESSQSPSESSEKPSSPSKPDNSGPDDSGPDDSGPDDSGPGDKDKPEDSPKDPPESAEPPSLPGQPEILTDLFG